MIGILKGMTVTLKHQFTRAVTVQYPKVRPKIPERSRGWLELDSATCTGCGICAKSCPISVITVSVKTTEDKKRLLERWEVRTDRCMFCGICAESCPKGIIRMVPAFELANTDKKAIVNVQAENIFEPADTGSCPVKDECPVKDDE